MSPYAFEQTRGSPSIAFEHTGSGTPILFVHGVGGNRSSWYDQLGEFGRGHRAVAIDLRGYGDSDDYDGPLRFDEVVDDCVRVLDQLGATRCHFVGLSMGGLVGQVFLCQRPERLASATLADTGTGASEGRDSAWVEAFLAARRKPLLEQGKRPADIAPELARTLLSAAAPAALLERVAAIIGRLRVEPYLKALEAVARFSSPAGLSAVRLPVLLPVGVDDALTPPRAAHRLAQRFERTQAQVVELKGAGHLSNMEQPAAFNAALREFIERVERVDRSAR